MKGREEALKLPLYLISLELSRFYGVSFREITLSRAGLTGRVAFQWLEAGLMLVTYETDPSPESPGTSRYRRRRTAGQPESRQARPEDRQ